MSKLFNAQNLSNLMWKEKEYLIYFTNQHGQYLIYRYNHITQKYSLVKNISELLKAENIYVSYSYLGGIHISNYVYTKRINGDKTIFNFTLGKITSSGSTGTFWDIPNAAFITKQNDFLIEPIKSFEITLVGSNPGSIFDTTFTTFIDGSIKNTVDYGDYVVNGITNYLLDIKDNQSQSELYQGVQAMSALLTDCKSTSPVFQAFRVGHYNDVTVNYYFQIIANPSDATVYINGQQVSSIQVPAGTTINWTVERAGYVTRTGSYVVYGNYTMNVDLSSSPSEEEFTFAIIPSPDDSTVILVISGQTYYTNSIQVSAGTQITWTVEKEGYVTQTGSYTVYGNYTMNVALSTEDPEIDPNDNPGDNPNDNQGDGDPNDNQGNNQGGGDPNDQDPDDNPGGDLIDPEIPIVRMVRPLSSRSSRSEPEPILNFLPTVPLIAAFFGLVKIGGQWYQRLYLVQQADHSFDISTKDEYALSAIIERISTEMDYQPLESNLFDYYQFDEI